MSEIPPAATGNDPEATPSASGVPGRWSSAGRVLAWSVCVGLVGGLAFGGVQAIAMGWRFGALMGIREWADALSYSGAAHAILWTAHGAIAGTACALMMFVSRRMRRGVVPEGFALAALGAGASAFLVWSGATVSGVSISKGVQGTWCAVMGVYWLLAASVGYALAHLLVGSFLSRWAGRAARLAVLPTTGILLICLVIQWFERPQLLENTTRWKQAGETSRRADARPDIVLIVLDTQRLDRLGCYGCRRPTTPRLDAFAADALVYDRCISPAIWTLPSHASMFTGLFPSEHGASYNHMWLDEGFATMAELLDGAGYQTVALSNNVWISDSSNLSQGFDRVIRPASLHHPRGNSISEFVTRVLCPAGRVGKWLGAVTTEDAGAKYTSRLAARWLDRRDRSRPFFMFVNYLEPHHPYRPSLPHREVFIGPDDVDRSYRYNWSKAAEFSLLRQACYTVDELRLLNQTYDAESRWLDDYVGELLEVLAGNASLDDVLVIITSDHGENLGDHHLMAHSWCVYDTLAHVPLILRYPKRLRPGRCADLAQLTDLLPTVLDAARGRSVPTPSTFGRSLLPPTATASAPASRSVRPRSATTGPADHVAVTERMAPRRSPIDRVQRLDVRFDRTPLEGVLRGIRRGAWKYIVAADGREELYNVVDDPGEARNRLGDCRAIADALADRLRQWLAASRPYQSPAPQGGGRSLDEETRGRLRDLGYIQ